MSHTETVWDMSAQDLEDQVLGKRVEFISETDNSIHLDDGTVLRLEDTSSCCAWFNAELKKGNLTDNAITAVEEVPRQPDEEYNESWSLNILAADTRLATVDIEGNPTSGYYCHSVNLIVTKGKSE